MSFIKVTFLKKAFKQAQPGSQRLLGEIANSRAGARKTQNVSPYARNVKCLKESTDRSGETRN